MIDLLLWAATKADLANWALTTPPAAPLAYRVEVNDGGTITSSIVPAKGIHWGWWRDDGKMLLPGGGKLAGVVALLRLHTTYFDADRIGTSGEQWAKSKVAQYIRNNGTPGTVAGGVIPYYEVGGVRIFRPADVQAWLAANSLPGHQWVGGNAY